MNYTQSITTLREMRAPIEQKERFKYNIKNIVKGSFVKVLGDLCIVKNVFTYKEGKNEWFEYELYSIVKGTTTYIEYEEDDKIEMCITTETFNARELPVSMDDIEEMADEEEGSIQLKMNTYYYDDDYQANFMREDETKESVYLYEFSNETEDTFLTIEEWGNKKDGYAYQCFISKTLNDKDLEIISI